MQNFSSKQSGPVILLNTIVSGNQPQTLNMQTRQGTDSTIGTPGSPIKIEFKKQVNWETWVIVS